jgi:Cut8, nuclear proteasome tether protein
MMAWSHVRATPVWDNAQHNTIRRQCFKTLSSYCLYALRNLVQEWDIDTVFQVKQKVERLRVDSEDVEACLSYLNSNTAINLPAESNE